MNIGELKERGDKYVIEIELNKEDTGSVLDYRVYEEVARSQGCVLEDGTGDVWRFVWDAVTRWIGKEHDRLHYDEFLRAEREEAREYQRRIDEARARGDEKTAQQLEWTRGQFDEEIGDEEDEEDFDPTTVNQEGEDEEPASWSSWS